MFHLVNKKVQIPKVLYFLPAVWLLRTIGKTVFHRFLRKAVTGGLVDFSLIKNFNSSEFDSPDRSGSGVNMQHAIVKILDDGREKQGLPWSINSGYRTKEHNATLENASATSSHLYGYAVDLHCSDFADQKAKAKILYDLGIRRFGLYKNLSGSRHIHIDNDPKKPEAVWTYVDGNKQAFNLFNPKNL